MKNSLLRHAFAALVLALLAPLAAAAPKALAPDSFESPLTDAVFTVRMKVTNAGLPVAGATVTFSVSTTVNASAVLLQTSAVSDANGVASVQAQANDWAGTYTVNAMSGPDNAAVPVTNRARQFLALQYPNFGLTSIQLTTESTTCMIKTFDRFPSQDAPGAMDLLPLGRTPLAGFVQFRLKHCEKANVVVRIRFADTLPANAEMWVFGHSLGRSDSSWHRASSETSIGEGVMRFSLSDMSDGDDDVTDNDEIVVPLAGVLVPAAAAYPLVQDIWWSGVAENGWGASIIQHGSVLFTVIYAYDAAGKPTWFVMPGGTWNAAHTQYTGAVYTPKGTPFYAYDRTGLDVRPPVGNVTLTFTDGSHGTLAYTIDGRSGTKAITRNSYGTPATPTLNGLTDMWWGGEFYNGFGIAVIQQYAQLFVVWYSYDDAGKATWFVMPAGSWTSFDTYEGPVYTTTGSPWVGVPYDPSKLVVTEAGSYKMVFSGGTAVFTYQVGGHSGQYPLSRQLF